MTYSTGRGIGSSNSDTPPPPPLSYVDFWMDLFSSLRAEEQYVALRAVDELPLGEFAGVDLLRGQFTGARSVRACTWHRMNPSADMHFLGGRVTSVVIERWCKSVAPMGNGRVGGAGVFTAPKVPFHERRASRSRQRTQEVGYRNREIQYFGYRGKSANAQDRICLGFAGFLW